MIDWKRVQDLRDEIGPDGFLEVADMFLGEADDAVAALLAGPPTDQIVAQLHFLKGSALNLGLTELAAICQDGERQVIGNATARVDVAEVAAIYQASRAQLLGRIAQLAAA